jgi:hypothetical protein
MKKVNIFLISIILLSAAMISGCQKGVLDDDTKPGSSGSPTPTSVGGSMKFTSSGTAITYNNCLATDASANGVNQTLIMGLNLTNNVAGADNFEVDIIQSLSALKAGQVYPASTSFTQPNSMALFYYPNATDEYVTQPANAQGSVTITGVTSTTISGTFSGTLFASDDLNGTTVKATITEGTFTAKIN